MYWAVENVNSLVWNDGYLQKNFSKKSHDALFDIHEELLKDPDISNEDDRIEISNRLIESINLFRRKNGMQSYEFQKVTSKTVLTLKTSEEPNKFISGEDKLHIAFINRVIDKYEVPREAWKILKTRY